MRLPVEHPMSRRAVRVACMPDPGTSKNLIFQRHRIYKSEGYDTIFGEIRGFSRCPSYGPFATGQTSFEQSELQIDDA